ncbi:hypothetical protein KVV02_007043 [Mortierella alpina]|uniref:Dynactin subunit 5 n=1 Tax=Mortierella alpina TaxID=64518 RepID=A0A9P7ZZP1_MORAP|nr:hypothetical protein KVV02_007043 [Mortierella alpina]
MDLPIVKYSKSEYIETDTGNKVSRKSVICGSQNIILGGKVRNPTVFASLQATTFSYYPIKIGDHVTIGEGTIVQAATIGSFVTIGKNCVIGRFAIIKDCSRIEDNTVIPPNSVVPSFSVYKGSPGKLVDELPESIQEICEARTKDRYAKFIPSTE